jgi:dihydroflavonol-4-reductase
LVVGLHRPGREHRIPGNVKKRQGDVLDPVSLLEAFEGITTVIHCAAYVSFNPRRRKKLLEVNVEGTKHVVNACLQKGIRNLIHVSSVAALGSVPGQPISEESTWTNEVSSDYGLSKYLAELEVFRGAEEGLTVSIVNPSVILSAVRLHRSSAALLDYVWNERKFYTKGSLNYVDGRDVTEAVFRLYQHPRPGEKFILSAGSLPLKDFFERVAGQLNKRAVSVRISPGLSAFVTGREPMITRQSARLAQQTFHFENKKAQQVLGLQFRSLDETIAWCSADYVRNVKLNKQKKQVAGRQ